MVQISSFAAYSIQKHLRSTACGNWAINLMLQVFTGSRHAPWLKNHRNQTFRILRGWWFCSVGDISHDFNVRCDEKRSKLTRARTLWTRNLSKTLNALCDGSYGVSDSLPTASSRSYDSNCRISAFFSTLCHNNASDVPKITFEVSISLWAVVGSCRLAVKTLFRIQMWLVAVKSCTGFKWRQLWF